MKCSACQANLCEKNYDLRHKCLGEKEEIVCTCTCQVSGTETMVTSALSAGVGVAAVAGGIALTVLTGGWFAIIAGAAAVGGGSSLVMSPIQKKISGECMTIKDTVVDTAFGATIGAVTGPIGAGGSMLAQGASGVVKLGVRSGAGAVAGVVSGGVSEISRAARGEEVTFGSVAKSMGIGAAAGAVGGMSTHIGSNASKLVSNGAAKAVTRIGVQAATTAATDATLQVIDKGEVDTKQLLFNTAGAIAVSTTAEATQSVSKRTDTYNKRINKELITNNIDKDGNKANVIPEELQKQLETQANNLNSMEAKVVDENLKNVNEYNKLQSDIDRLTTHKEELIAIKKDPQLDPRQRHEKQEAYIKENKLPKGGVKQINKNINDLNTKSGEIRPQRIGEDNAHFLHGERNGQVAVDLAPPNPETGERSGQRAIFEKHNGKFYYADHTLDHNYDGCKEAGNIKNTIYDPYNALHPENLNPQPMFDEEDDEKKNK